MNIAELRNRIAAPPKIESVMLQANDDNAVSRISTATGRFAG
jgi:hypothetical protein